MTGVVIIDPPDWPLLDTDEAVKHLRAPEDGTDDAEIEAMILAVCEQVDGPGGDYGIAIGRQTLEAAFDGFPGGDLELPYPPLVSVVSVTYLDTTGETRTLDPSLYEVDLYARPGVIRPAFGQCWPAVAGECPAPLGPGAPVAHRRGRHARRGSVKVRYLAGYEALPNRVRSGLLLLLGDLYANRESQRMDDGRGVLLANPTADRLLGALRPDVVR